MSKSNAFVWVSIVSMAVLSLWSLSYRYRVEASNRAVGVLMDAQVVNDLAAASGSALSDVLSRLKDAGLTGVALTEENVGDMIDQGEVVLEPKEPMGVTLRGDPTALSRVARGVARRGGLASSPGPIRFGSLGFDGDVRALRSTSAGLDTYDATLVRESGLVIVGRIANVIGAGPAYIHDILDECKSLGASALLASGEQVLGQRDSIEDTASSLKVLKMQYLTPEFTKTAGDARVAAFMPEDTIRLHSMQQPEVDKATPRAIVDRYKLAYRERNVRWLLVRPVTFGGPDPVGAMAKSLASIREGVASEGGAVKPPRPFRDPGVPKFLFALIALSAIPWLIYLSRVFFASKALRFVAAVGVVVLAGGAWFDSVRPYSALLIGIAGPVAAYALWLESREKPWNPFLAFIGITAISLATGLAVAGLLNGLPYMIQVKQALGIKAILILPVLLVGWLLLSRHWPVRDLLRGEVRWGQVMLGMLVAGGLLMLLVRSGNESPGAVSDLELKMRALLDRLMYARPRTKEFLLGHPALLLGLLMYPLAQKSAKLMPPAVILLVVGAIGQSDIVDTLCHLHTPLDVGMARVAVGFVLGGIIGVLAWLPVRALAKRIEGT